MIITNSFFDFQKKIYSESQNLKRFIPKELKRLIPKEIEKKNDSAQDDIHSLVWMILCMLIILILIILVSILCLISFGTLWQDEYLRFKCSGLTRMIAKWNKKEITSRFEIWKEDFILRTRRIFIWKIITSVCVLGFCLSFIISSKEMSSKEMKTILGTKEMKTILGTISFLAFVQTIRYAEQSKRREMTAFRFLCDSIAEVRPGK